MLSILIMVSMPFYSFAGQSNQAISFKSIADNIIEKQIDKSENYQTITYKNIEDFVTKTKELIPDTNDLELAKFILEYTNQDYSNLPDEIILETIGFNEISIVDQYIKVSEDGQTEYISKNEAESAVAVEKIRENMASITPLNEWTSPNGYMKIRTSYLLASESSNYKYYIISAEATWLKIPSCFFEDVLTIGHTGKYDNTYNNKYGYLSETINCCGTKKTYKWETTNNNSGVNFEYSATTFAAIRFKLINASASGHVCNRITNNHSKSVSSISSFIRYRVIFTKNSANNIQSAYCHKQIALGSISISASNGSVSFSLSGTKKEYKIEPILIYA